MHEMKAEKLTAGRPLSVVQGKSRLIGNRASTLTLLRASAVIQLS